MNDRELLELLRKQSILHDIILDVMSDVLTKNNLSTEKELIKLITERIDAASKLAEKYNSDRENDISVTGEGGKT